MATTLALVLAAADVAEPDVSEAEPQPRLVIDVYPGATMRGLLLGIPLGGLMLHLPVSVTWAIGPQTALYAQLAFTVAVPGYGPDGVTIGASLGPQFSFGPSALRGFFLTPLFTAQVTSARSQLGTARCAGPVDFGATWSAAAMLGLQAGYQWTWGHRHIAVMLGASVGYAYDNHGAFIDAFGVQRGTALCGQPMRRDQGFVFGVNTELFRIGFAL
ncbi:MAG: autotransporter domain-containing protein [Myxococcaceae bacterium]|nr:autotransporter domain-containing protein [Myxococcaceae bacterium]